MAYNYQSFATLGVNLNRQNYGSLDISQVFTSQADLNYYMSKGSLTEGVSQYWLDTVPYPYAGQYVALVDNATRGVTPYILTEKEDGTFEATKLGVPDVDGKTIQINDEGKLEAIIPEIEIPEYVDTNTTYKLSVTETTEEDSEQGVKITLTPYDGETAGTSQSFIIADQDLSDYITTSELNTELAKKANAADVYTTTETDQKIGEAIAAADHLKRKIVNSKEDINVNAPDALQYIYMVPIGPTDDDNKYREYIVLENTDGSRYIEQVGNWEVDLSGYLTEADASNTYATADRVSELEEKASAKVDRVDVYIISEADEKFATKNEVTETLKDYVTDDELSSTLNNYATKDEIPVLPNFEDYVTEEEFTERIADYETAETAEGKYAGKDNTYTKEEVDDLLDDKVDISTATSDEGVRFINQTEINKLSKLNLDDEQEITISGSVNASQVKELYPTVVKIITGSASDLDTEQEGLQLGLNIAEGAEVNKINSVSANFNIVGDNKELQLVSVPVTKLSGLGEEFKIDATTEQLVITQVSANKIADLSSWVTNNRNTIAGLYPTSAATLLSQHDDRLKDIEDALIWKNLPEE